MTDPGAIIDRNFPGQRAPVLAAARWMDVAPSTLYRYVKDPTRMPRHFELLFLALDLYGPDAISNGD